MIAEFAVLALLAASARAGTCASYAGPAPLGDLSAVPATESSGLAASRAWPGVWYTHDDSGGDAQLYAFNLAGDDLGTWPVGDGLFVDWEDMAAGPCPDGSGSCLYIGDIGDNARLRRSVHVLVVPEPSVEPTAASATTLLPLDIWYASWPDGAEDSETLLVHPITGDVTLISKNSDGESLVGRLVPGGTSAAPTPLEIVGTLALEGDDDGARRATGGDWDLEGDRVVVRTYAWIWEWQADRCDPDAHWAEEPRRLPHPTDPHGEAAAFSLAGDLVTSSEGVPMTGTVLRCEALSLESAPCPEEDLDQDPPTDGAAHTVEGEPRDSGVPLGDPLTAVGEEEEPVGSSPDWLDEDPRACGCGSRAHGAPGWGVALLALGVVTRRSPRSTTG